MTQNYMFKTQDMSTANRQNMTASKESVTTESSTPGYTSAKATNSNLYSIRNSKKSNSFRG